MELNVTRFCFLVGLMEAHIFPAVFILLDHAIPCIDRSRSSIRSRSLRRRPMVFVYNCTVAPDDHISTDKLP